MHDKHSACIEKVESRGEVAIRGCVIVKGINKDDIVAQSLCANLGKAFTDIHSFGSKINGQAILEAGRAIIHETMRGRQGASVQKPVEMACF